MAIAECMCERKSKNSPCMALTSLSPPQKKILILGDLTFPLRMRKNVCTVVSANKEVKAQKVKCRLDQWRQNRSGVTGNSAARKFCSQRHNFLERHNFQGNYAAQRQNFLGQAGK